MFVCLFVFSSAVSRGISAEPPARRNKQPWNFFISGSSRLIVEAVTERPLWLHSCELVLSFPLTEEVAVTTRPHIYYCRSPDMNVFTCWWHPLDNLTDGEQVSYVLTYSNECVSPSAHTHTHIHSTNSTVKVGVSQGEGLRRHSD